MNEDIRKEYRKARTASRVGSLVMYAMAAFCLLSYLLVLFAQIHLEIPADPPLAHLTATHVGLLSAFLGFLLLGEFLRHFGTDNSPFGRSQSRRLLVAGLFIFLHSALEPFAQPIEGVITPGGSPVPVSLDNDPALNLTKLAFAAFVICLAMVVRYGNALKEDSDSIL